MRRPDGDERSAAVRHEWHLNASSLHTDEVMLNGVPLRAEASAAGEMPELPPAIVGEEPAGGGEPGGGGEEAARPAAPPEAAAGAASTVLVVGARSVSFVVLPRASWAECRRRTV